MLVGSLFSGIGGLELGLEMAGIGPVTWQVEKDAFCRSLLSRHWPEVTRYDDITTLDTRVLAPVDLICGGFPCQDISSAGKGAGLAGERSGLWREFARIVSALRPRWVVVENVASGANRWLDAVVRDLEGEHGRVGGRTAELRALGNAVVPQCAAVIGWVIQELDKTGENTMTSKGMQVLTSTTRVKT
jgi:site-specific DNA-cytosine methylase